MEVNIDYICLYILLQFAEQTEARLQIACYTVVQRWPSVVISLAESQEFAADVTAHVNHS